MNDPRTSDGVEIAELVDFLATTAPFDQVPDALVRTAARRMEITYAPSGTTVLPLEAETEALYLIRSGAVELHNETGALVARLGERDFFGYPSLLTETPAGRAVTTIEDTLLYLLPEAVFHHLCNESEAFSRFFARAHAARIRDALRERRDERPLTTPVRELAARDPVCAAPSTSIQEAARIMADARVSSLLLREGDRLRGILTDRDLRTRVVAEGRDPSAAVSTVMSADPATITASTPAFEALLAMSRHNVHHLPVMDGDTLVGMVTTTDLMRLQADNPVYLVGEVWKQTDVQGLVQVSTRLPDVVRQLVRAHARAEDVARVVTAVSDALTERLLHLGEAKFGDPPVPYAWLALGSQARHEQTAHSDQDNALLLSDEADLETHDAYFHDLAEFVTDGLNACGYEYCPGEVMAVTDRWRQPLAQWRRYFRTWITEPEPKALMHASIFFDLRHIYGAADLTRSLRTFIRDNAARNTIFLAALTANALDHKPPLGFFRQFVLEEHGGQKDTLDLKHNGVVPIVDIARIFSLAHGIEAVNTLDRLDALADDGGMAASDAADLRDAHAFINSIRLQHQSTQLRRGETPDNFVSPDTLSPFDRRHLKDAFKIVSRMQTALSQRYQTEFIS